jgi:hypothetical protein
MKKSNKIQLLIKGVGKMSVSRKCRCTKCNKEFDTILPNNNDVWLTNIMCTNCFDEWLSFKSIKGN